MSGYELTHKLKQLGVEIPPRTKRIQINIDVDEVTVTYETDVQEKQVASLLAALSSETAIPN